MLRGVWAALGRRIPKWGRDLPGPAQHCSKLETGRVERLLRLGTWGVWRNLINQDFWVHVWLWRFTLWAMGAPGLVVLVVLAPREQPCPFPELFPASCSPTR